MHSCGDIQNQKKTIIPLVASMGTKLTECQQMSRTTTTTPTTCIQRLVQHSCAESNTSTRIVLFTGKVLTKRYILYFMLYIHVSLKLPKEYNKPPLDRFKCIRGTCYEELHGSDTDIGSNRPLHVGYTYAMLHPYQLCITSVLWSNLSCTDITNQFSWTIDRFYFCTRTLSSPHP